MKLDEVIYIPDSQTYGVFCDLDGVLVDFDKKAKEVAGMRPGDSKEEAKLRNDFWKIVGKYSKAGNKFFEAMEPMPDAFDLWSYIEKYSPIICSATGHLPGAAEEKRAWVRKHLGHEVANRALFVRDAKLKSQYAKPKHILIDDRRKALDPWVAAGGIGIQHTSANSTIAKLKELGL